MSCRLESFAPYSLFSHFLQLVTVTVVAMSLSACGGSSDGGSGPGPEPALQVMATSPQADASGLSVTTLMTAEFNRPLLATSVSPETIRLSIDGEPVASDVRLTLEGNGVQLIPEQPLALLRRYTVTLSSDISDIDGNLLGKDYRWRFITADGQWREAHTLRQSVGSRVQQFRQVDAPSGSGLVIWSELPEGTGFKELWSSSPEAGAGMVPTAPVPVSENGGRVVRWEMASNKDGDALVTWLQADDDVLNLYARLYSADSGQWGSATMLAEDLRLPDFRASPALSASGDAVLAWSAINVSSGRQELFTRHYSVQEDRWSESEVVNPALEHGFAPRLVIGGDGWATLLYLGMEMGALDSQLLVQRYHPADGWQPVEELSNQLADHWTHTLTTNGQGKVVVIWQEAEPTATRLRARQFVPGGASGVWQPAASLIHDRGAYNGYSLTMDEVGNVALMWSRQETGEEVLSRHQVAHFLATENQWLAGPVALGVSPDYPTYGQLAGNAQGELVAVWPALPEANAAEGALIGRRFDPDTRRWSSAMIISASAARKGQLAAAMDPEGHSLVAWSEVVAPQGQQSGTTRVLASRYNRYTGEWEMPEALGERQRAGIGVLLRLKENSHASVVWGSAARYDSDLMINELTAPDSYDPQGD